jgi:hypothetical protein
MAADEGGLGLAVFDAVNGALPRIHPD